MLSYEAKRVVFLKIGLSEIFVTSSIWKMLSLSDQPEEIQHEVLEKMLE